MADGLLGNSFADSQAGISVNVYRTLEDILRNDVTLSNLIRTWDTRTNRRNETVIPDPTMFPWVALVPMGFELRQETDDEFSGHFLIRIDVGVAGTYFDDLGNTVEAIFRALRRNMPTRTGESVITRFQNVGVNNFWPKTMGLGTRNTPPSGQTAGAPQVDQFGSLAVDFEIFYPNISPDFPALP